MLVIANDLRGALADLPDPETSTEQVRRMLVTLWREESGLATAKAIPVKRQRFVDPDGVQRWVWTLDLPG